jgi:hypothetical protein
MYLELKTIVLGPGILVAWEPVFQECLQLVALNIATHFRSNHIKVGVSGHLKLWEIRRKCFNEAKKPLVHEADSECQLALLTEALYM